jgi:hypothetical protein
MYILTTMVLNSSWKRVDSELLIHLHYLTQIFVIFKTHLWMDSGCSGIDLDVIWKNVFLISKYSMYIDTMNKDLKCITLHLCTFTLIRRPGNPYE